MQQFLYHVSEYDETLIYQAIDNILTGMNILSDLTPDMKIVLKPNLVMAKKPDVPVTTHPMVVKAVARWLYEHDRRHITIAESSGGPYTSEHMKNVYQICGMYDAAPYADLNMNFGFQSVHTPEGFVNGSFNLILPVIDADYIINLPKLKTHAMTGYSGGIKNLFGCVPGLQKPQLHYRFPDIENFSNMLLALALTVRPQITILDAIDAMEGNGPTGGTSHPLHLLLASRDMYTQDAFAAQLMGLHPSDIVMLRQAKERGLIHTEQMELIGDAVPQDLTPFLKPDTADLDFSSKVPSFLQKPFSAVMKRVLKSYPKLEPEKCIGCGKCAESCPAHIITIKDKKARFHRKGCISCFCCQEMCPMKAIAVKKAI